MYIGACSKLGGTCTPPNPTPPTLARSKPLSLTHTHIHSRSLAQVHAALLYEALNNSVTPAGRRVAVFLDARRLVKGEDWEQGFASGLLRSVVALPLVSLGMLEPLAALRGGDDDAADNLFKELLIMQAVSGAGAGNLRRIYPILIGQPCGPKDPRCYALTLRAMPFRQCQRRLQSGSELQGSQRFLLPATVTESGMSVHNSDCAGPEPLAAIIAAADRAHSVALSRYRQLLPSQAVPLLGRSGGLAPQHLQPVRA